MTRRIVKRLSARERTAFITAAREWLNKPYRHRGRCERGVDCIGLPAVALAAVGREIRDERVYSPAPDGLLLRDALIAHFGAPIPKDQLQPGDIALMRWHQHPNHVGIVTEYPLGGLALLHSLAANRMVIEHRLADPWTRRIIEGFRP